MKKKNGNHKILDVIKACSAAADIQDFEAEIEAEELHGNDKFDWRVAGFDPKRTPIRQSYSALQLPRASN